MSDCLSTLGVTFLTFGNFDTFLFDAKTMDICTMHTCQFEIRDGYYFLLLRYLGLHHNWDAQFYLMVGTERKHTYKS